MISPQQMVVEVRQLLNAGFLAFDAARRVRVQVTDSTFPDETLQIVMNRAKRTLFRAIGTANATLLLRQDTFTYPTSTEFVEIVPPDSRLSRRVVILHLIEDVTDTNYPLPVRELNFQNRIQNNPGAWGSLGRNGDSPYTYSWQGTRFFLLPPRSPAVALRFNYTPEPEPIDVRSEGPEEQIPEVALDWFLHEAAAEAAKPFGIPPDLKADWLRHRAEALRLVTHRTVGPKFGNFTRMADVIDTADL